MSDPDLPDEQAHGRLARLQQQHDQQLDGFDLHSLLIEVSERLARGEAADASPEMILAGDAVAEQLTSILDVHENRFGRGRYRDLFWLFHHLLDSPKPPVTGAAYLELGSGSVNPLALGLVFVAAGASSFTGVDLEQIQDEPRAARAMARLIDAMLADPTEILLDLPITRDGIVAHLHDVDAAALRGGDLGGRGPRLGLVKGSAHTLPSETSSINVVISNSFLEHVEDIDAVFGEIARVTRVGGFSVHQIDGIDHLSYEGGESGPHDFLREPPGGMVHGSNRIRVLEFPAIFERHGFEVQQVLSRQIEIADDEVAAFSEPWRSMPREVLETVQATIVARRV
jgi:SAM-dependent methyltransferase